MENTICVNSYIPYYPIKKDTLHDTLLRNKYEDINKDKKEYFKLAKIVNFDLIHNECRGTPLENNVNYYQTIDQDRLERAREEDKYEFIAEAIKSKRDDLHIEKEIIIRHFRETPELIRFKQKNKVLLSSMHGRIKKKEYNSKIMLYSHLKIK